MNRCFHHRLLNCISILLAVLTLSLRAQDVPPDRPARIHGRVINPSGQPQSDGTVGLSTDGGVTLTYTFPVSATGEYHGQVAPAEYIVIYRAPDTPEGKAVDFITGVVVASSADVAQDIDMTRQEYMNRLSPEQQRQIQAMRAAAHPAAPPPPVNPENPSDPASAALNADLSRAGQDMQDIENARANITKSLDPTATAEDIVASVAEVQNAKLTDIETMMKKDTALRPDQPALWMNLGYAQLALREFDDAESSYKKALALAQPSQNGNLIAAADVGLGEVYARSLMVDEANAAFVAAAKADPLHGAEYLRMQALIFYREKNAPAQVEAADEAIKADPSQPMLYYIKATGLALNAPLDPNSNKLIYSPECFAAFRKYLELAPDGRYAADVKRLLDRAESAPAPPADPGAN